MIKGRRIDGERLRLGLDGAGRLKELEPPTVRRLFKHIGTAPGEPGLSGSPDAGWQIVSFGAGIENANLWDLCHDAVSATDLALGPGSVAFAEPNLVQHWRYDNRAGIVAALTAGCAEQPPKESLPTGSDRLWYRDEVHANFTGAPDGSGARIAHLDTGYDPEHKTLPRNLDTAHGWNFVENERATNDRAPGPGLTAFGHGTGTLGLLAGQGVTPDAPPIGGAPGATVVPLRVANGVVLFYNSAIAAAFDHVYGLCDDPATFVDVVTMSMGGLASQAWAEAINALYERGVFVVTAAGNNYSNLPTRFVVFPARFRRVVAACGVMADSTAYADLAPGVMAGNYGPLSKMNDSSLAAYTPNVPWPKLGCPEVVNRDGAGTSAATPQIAAAAAIWIQAQRAKLEAYPHQWMRVEAVRSALFGGARQADRDHFGRGQLDLGKALGQGCPAAAELRCEPRDNAWFPLIRALIGVGLDDRPSPRAAMLELEALQLSQNHDVERILPNPDAGPFDSTTVRRVVDIFVSSPRASKALRAALGPAGSTKTSYSLPPPGPSTTPPPPSNGKLSDGRPAELATPVQLALEDHISAPPYRPLRVYAFDPTLSLELNALAFNETILNVKWEPLAPGPIGEYLEVIDVDPPSSAAYAPVDLEHPHVLVKNGRSPAEANPQFHQQMVYAVAMKTIEYFERALGRTALWAPLRERGEDGQKPDRFVQRLRIYPHALREANAYYSTARKALLFGYFVAGEDGSSVQAPGTMVFTALSHDIIAHETTHALLDGLHRRYLEPTNPDVLAFHEGFADIVALFQHFTLAAALRSQIRLTGADLRRENLLAGIARQFGQATDGRSALRQYVGIDPTRTEYQQATEVHERGAVLVAAVFDAFLKIYRVRADRIISLATLGSGVLPPGAIPDIVVDRLADEAAKVAAQWLNICIRALDYCPPVDITFGDYLRALITADRDLVPDDKLGYRTAFVTAFRDRGIYAEDVRTISPNTLVWERPEIQPNGLPELLKALKFDWDLRADRERAFEEQHANAMKFRDWLVKETSDLELYGLGIFRSKSDDIEVDGVKGSLHAPEVHAIRPARRIGPDGQLISDIVIEITQSWYPTDVWAPVLRGGVTLLADLQTGKIRYSVRKRVAASTRYLKQRKFAQDLQENGLRGTYGAQFAADEALALAHRTAMNRQPEKASKEHVRTRPHSYVSPRTRRLLSAKLPDR